MTQKHSPQNIISRLNLSQVLYTLSLIYIILLSCYFTVAALGMGLGVDTYAANGTFQLYNPLRRMAEGQILGHDFPFFHGVSVPLIHYPLFEALGHNLFAAEVVKWTVSPLLFIASAIVFFLCYFRSLRPAIISSAVYIIISLYCIDAVQPGNSLMGVRTTGPMLVAAFMLLHSNWTIPVGGRKFNLYRPVLHLLMGLAVSMGTEQGVSLVLAYIMVRGYSLYKQGSRSFIRAIIVLLLESLSILCLTLIVIAATTGGHPLEAMRYALIDIPKDQGWYFGAPPNGILAWNTLDYLLDPRLVIYMLPVIAAGLTVFILGQKSGRLCNKKTLAFATMATYGVVVFAASITGYWAPSTQLIPLARVTGAILVAISIQVCITKVDVSKLGHRIIYTPLVGICILSIIVVAETAFIYKRLSYLPVDNIVKSSIDARRQSDYGVMSEAWKKRYDAFAPYINTGSSVWSTYTGVYESMINQFGQSPGGEDYIIHALGPERRANYTQTFINKKPDYVITLKPSYFIYEEWLWSRHWDFYREVVTNYSIATENDSHFLWKRVDDSNSRQAFTQKGYTTKRLSSYEYSLTLPAADIGVYEVTVDYTINPPFPGAEKLSRYVLELSNSKEQRYPISLPHYKNKWTFPVITTGTSPDITLKANVYGLINSGLTITSVEINHLLLNKDSKKIFIDNLDR